jgi:trimeric autotransporter adhesin
LQTGSPVQYSTAGAPTTANGLIPSNNMTLVGKVAGGVVLDNVAPGSTLASSTQAINGGQLNTGLASVAANFGGGATFDPLTGKVTAPSYAIGANTYNNVGSALADLASGGAKSKYFNANSTLADSLATGTDSVAIGPNAVALNKNDVALGAGSTTAAPNTGAYTLNGGAASAIAPTSVVSIGSKGAERQLQNVAAGVISATSTDAVNGSQLFTVGTAVNNLGAGAVAALGGGAKIAPDGTVTAPSYVVGGNTYGDVGSALAAQGKLGVQYTPDALGNPTAVVDLAANKALPVGTTGVALSGLANATTASGAVALGQMPMQYATAGSPTTANPAVASNNVTLVGGAAGSVVLDNVAAGSTVAGSTQAINGGQLNMGLASVATNLGGGSVYDPVTGTVTAPSYTIGATAFNNVGSALGAVNTSLANLTNGTSGLVQQIGGAPGSGALTVGASTGGTSVSFTGTAGDRTLTGVAAGTIAAASTDAVNGSQIAANQASVATALGGGSKVNPDGTVSAPSYAVGSYTVGDVGAAIAALQTGSPVQYSTAGAPTTANGLIPSNNMTLVGAAAGPVTLDNVAPGSLLVGSTQAVNGGQINTIGTSIAANFGAGAAFDPLTGKVTAPSYTIGANTYNNVGSALTALDSSVNGGAGIKYFRTNSTLADATASGTDATAIGPMATASGSNSVALGNGAAASDTGAIAIGNSAAAKAIGAMALGDASSATGVNSVALGAGSTDGGQANVVSIGAVGAERKLINVAGGTIAVGSTEGVNGGQIFANQASIAVALGGGSVVNPDGTLAAPSYAIGGTAYNNVGSALSALDNSVNGGAGIKYFRTNSTLADATASGTDATAVGPLAKASGVSSVAMGNGAVASATGAVALGQGATATGTNSVALGAGSTDGGQANVVSVGAVGAERKIVNVAPGTVAATSTDAINGSQLYGTANSVATALGGGSKVNPDGTISAPSYGVGGNTYTNVGGAVAALDTAVTGLQGQVASMPIQGNNTSKLAGPSATGVDATAVGFGSTATGANSVALGAGSTDGGVANVVSVGAVGAERKVVNVAAGAVTAASTDAVNGSQLFQTNQQVAALDRKGVQYATTPSGSTKSEINLQSDAGGPVVIHNLAAGVAPTDAANVAQVKAVEDIANNAVQYVKNADGSKSNAISLNGGTAANPVSIQNVAAGVNATDAVNLAQLQSVSSSTLATANSYTDKKISNLQAFTEQGLKDAKQLAISGTALALAASGLRYDDRPGKTSIAGATAIYKGTTGMAFGLGHTSANSNWRYNLSVNGTPFAEKPEIGVVVGASFTFN